MQYTSLDAYNEIKKNGLLSKRRFEVYEALVLNGPMTAHEVVDSLRIKYPKSNQTGFNARLSELQKMGVVTVVGEKVNPVSGHKNVVWETLNTLPKPLPKKLTNKQLRFRAEQFIKDNNLWEEYCNMYEGDGR